MNVAAQIQIFSAAAPEVVLLGGTAGPRRAGLRKRWLSCLAGGLGGALLGLASPASAQAPVGVPGLTASYYRGYFYDSLRFFTVMPPAISNRPIEQVNFVEAETDNFGVGAVATYYSPGRPDEFSGQFQGQLYILTPGQYTFYLGSDDAAYLWLDGSAQPLVCNKGDQFPYRETRGTCTLGTGLHTLRIAYGEHGGSQGLVLQYSGPGLPKQLIPNGVFYAPAAAIRPTLSQLTVAAGPPQVRVSWSVEAEQNSVAFVVQRSANGVLFEDVQRQASAGPGPHRYEVLDPQPRQGLSFYRLQQVRSDRPAVYSPIMAVEVKPAPFVFSVYPVPNEGSFYVQAPFVNTTNLAELKIVDITGHLAYWNRLTLNDGQPHYIEPGLAIGVYRLFITTEVGQFTQKVSLGQ